MSARRSSITYNQNMKDNNSMVGSSFAKGASRRTSIASVAASRLGISASKRNVAFESKSEKSVNKKGNVRVFHEDEDVTPKSLLSRNVIPINDDLRSVQSKSLINFDDGKSVGEVLNQSLYSGVSTFKTSFNAGFSKSMLGSMISSRASLDSVTDEISEPTCISNLSEMHSKKQANIVQKEPLVSADLNKTMNIQLEETETICLLEMPGITVSNLDDEIDSVIDRNMKYENLCATRQGNDMYLSRGMQTFGNDSKNKEMQCEPIALRDVGSMATKWDLYDTYHVSEVIEDEDDADDDLFSMATVNHPVKSPARADGVSNNISVYAGESPNSNSVTESVMMESCAKSFLTNSNTAANYNEVREESDGVKVINMAAEMKKVSNLPSMKEKLFIMERTVVQNEYHNKQAMYGGLSHLKLCTSVDPTSHFKGDPIVSKIGPNLSRLWSYECAATRGLALTCMAWNRANKDILAIGYSQHGFSSNGKGLVCIWCIKNPVYPERLFTPNCAVTALDFSDSLPNLLAVGLYNGNIILYNVHDTVDKPVMDSTDSNGKHSAPIWQLKWVTRDKGTGKEKGEVIVSASGDGRITQWSIRKGLEFFDLIKLKRTTNIMLSSKKKTGVGKKSDAFISRYSSGMCFDFHPSDNNIYLTGTEDGHIHRCSCSYNEQFLETYRGHKGPVYRSLWSPFDNDVFLTCSADWSVRLWHVNQTDPVLTFQASTKSVIDIDWSPVSSVMFAAINEHQIEIWDLNSSILDPLVINSPVSKTSFTTVKFALNAQVLIVGDCEGYATIYQLGEMNLDIAQLANQHALSKIISSSLPQTISSFHSNESNEVIR